MSDDIKRSRLIYDGDKILFDILQQLKILSEIVDLILKSQQKNIVQKKK